MLAAPAGFGKSTAVQQIAREYGNVVVCDFTFVLQPMDIPRRLIAALAANDSERTAALERSGEDEIDCASEALSGAAAATIVFENAQRIDDVPDAFPVFQRILDGANISARLAICTRKSLPLRFSRLAAPHETLWLRGGDLRFSREEIAASLPDAPASAVEQVANLSDGWPIVVRFLERLHAEGRLGDMPGDLSSSESEPLVSYLMNDIVGEFDRRELDIALAASMIPDPMLGDLTHAADDEDAHDAVVALDPFVCAREDGSLAVHPLIRAVLLRHYRPRARRLVATAAQRRQARGDDIRSAQLFLAAGEEVRGAQAITPSQLLPFSEPRLGLFDIIGRLEPAAISGNAALWNDASLLRWYTISPQQWLAEGLALWRNQGRSLDIITHANLACHVVNAYTERGRLDEAQTLLDAFEAGVLAAGREVAAITISTWRAILRVYRGQVTELAEVDDELAALRGTTGWEALYHSDIVARIHRATGDWPNERSASARAMSLAIASSWPVAIAKSAVDAAFGAWLAGEDELFEQYLAFLETQTGPTTREGVRHFIECARGRGTTAKDGFENLAARAQGWILAAARARDYEERVAFVRSAVGAADASNQPYYRVVARVVFSLVDPDGAAAHLATAEQIAAGTNLQQLRNAVAELAAGRTEGIFAALGARFAHPLASEVMLRIVDDTVLVGGVALHCSRLEREILTVLAVEQRPQSRHDLIAKIWPDSEPAAAAQTLKSYISRLRRKLGREAIVSTRRGYELGKRVTTDLAEMAAMLKTLSSIATNPAQYADVVEAFDRMSRRVRGREQMWEWFGPVELKLDDIEQRMGLALGDVLLAQKRPEAALNTGRRLTAIDPYDARARALVVRAFRALGEISEASHEIVEFERTLRADLGILQPSELRNLVSEEAPAGSGKRAR